MNIRTYWFLLLLFASAFLSSCSRDVLIDTTFKFDNQSWAYPQIPAFSFQIDDINVCYDIAVNLQVGEDYAYKNIYLLMHLKDTEGKEVQNRINLELIDDEGNWQGSGSAQLKSFKLPVTKDYCFDKAGTYVIGIEQNMRDSVLQSVHYVGLKVSKGNPVF
jgi:gliding motility-associated lipoprotein GldH